MEIGIEKRLDILTISLFIENFTSIFLSRLLEIEDYRQTISFGNKGSSLSFSQKINLLIDIGALDADQKNKFKAFMEIRNQFMHNMDADTYENCYKHIDGKEKYILKYYPQDQSISKEVQLEKATKDLSYEVLHMTADLYEKVKEKIKKEARFDFMERTMPVLLKHLDLISKETKAKDKITK